MGKAAAIDSWHRLVRDRDARGLWGSLWWISQRLVDGPY